VEAGCPKQKECAVEGERQYDRSNLGWLNEYKEQGENKAQKGLCATC
jgi:hypothetical protein